MSPTPLTLTAAFPNYNHARYLHESIGAMLNQSRPADEFLIIDDASTDNSVEIIEEFTRQSSRLRLVRNETNKGVEYNINRLINYSSSDYIYLGAADDRVLPGFFAKSMRLLEDHPRAGLCSAVGTLIGSNGENRGIRAMPVVSREPCFLPPDEVARLLCKYGRWITTTTAILRRDALIEEGGQDLSLGSFADTFAALVLALKHGACYIPEPLTCWRQMATGHGMSAAADTEGLREQGRRAVELMTNKYAGLFPAEYIRQFDLHRSYIVSMNLGRQVYRALEGELEHAAIASGQRQASRFTRVVIKLEAQVWKLYSIATLGPWRWWILGRLSIWLNLRQVIITEKLDA